MVADHLQLVADVVRAGSVARAARLRGVDPSVVSRNVAVIERRLGVPLFTRTTRRLAPTAACQLLLARAVPLLDELTELLDAVRSQDGPVVGNLRVLAPVSFALQWLLPRLPRFLKAHPGLHVDLRLNDALLDLVEERIDVAIRLGPLATSSYASRLLVPMVSRVCASPAYLKTHGTPRRPADLARHPCLLLDMPSFGDAWQFRNRQGEVSSVTVSGPVRSSNALALRSLALAGGGVILQADWIVAQDLRSGALVDLFPDFEVTASFFENAAWILRPSARIVPPKVEVFVKYLAAEASAASNAPATAARRRSARS